MDRAKSNGLLGNGRSLKPNELNELPPAPVAPVAVKQAPINLTAAIESIMPDIAAQWLTKNKANRKVKESTLQAYARDMKQGKWLISHQAIAFDDQGNLIDGQHRLMAIVRARIPVRMLVVRGIPVKQGAESTMDAVDRGVTRSVADHLGLHGFEDAQLLAGASGTIARLCVGDKAKVGKMTVAQTLAVVDLYRDHMVAVIANRSKQLGLKSALLLGVLAFARCANPAKIDQFHQALNTGANLALTSPPLVLRNWLMDKASLCGREKRMQEAEMVMHAAHQYLEGKTITKMVWNRAGVDFFRSKQVTSIVKITQMFL